MIDQVNNSVTSKPGVYAAFNTRNAMPYVVTTSPTNPNLIVVKDENEKKKHRWGLKIAIGAAAVGFIVLALAKGLPPSARNKLNEFMRGLDDKIASSENKSLNKIQSFYLSILKKIKVHGPKLEMIYNSAPLKDVLTKKSFQKVPILDKFSKWVTKVFEKISVKRVSRAYKGTGKKVNDMYKCWDDFEKEILADPNKLVTVNGRTQSAQAWVNEIKLRKVKVETNASEFADEPFKARVQEVKDDMKGLFDGVWGETYGNWRKIHKNKKVTQSFVSKELAADAKNKLNTKIEALRASITNDIADGYHSARKITQNLDRMLDTTDKPTRLLMKNIRRTIEDSSKLTGAEEGIQRSVLNSSLSSKLDELSQIVSNSSKYDEKALKEISGYIGDLRSAVINNPKGEIQEILTIYKQLLPREKYLALKRETYRAVNSLNKSVDFEIDKLFDKLRDLEIGSAPADALGVMSSAGIVGVGLLGADNHDDRVSVALKYGIPAVGAVATSLYCTLGLVSGGASLIIGTLSGLVINKIGTTLDNYIKKNKAQA